MMVRCVYCAREQERPTSGGCAGCGASTFTEVPRVDRIEVTSCGDTKRTYIVKDAPA